MLSFQQDGNMDLCKICNVQICQIFFLMGNMKRYNKIDGCGQSYVNFTFILPLSDEFTYIYIYIFYFILYFIYFIKQITRPLYRIAIEGNYKSTVYTFEFEQFILSKNAQIVLGLHL